MSSRMERVILVNSDDDADGDDEEEDDLYKGYNEFHPVLDTRNLQEDEMFKETLNKSSYGSRPSVSKHRTNTSTAGVAFNRSSVLKSRQTAASRGARTGRSGTSGGGIPVTASGAAGARPLTAIRGAGYSSHGGAGGALFDPLGLANSASSGVPGTAGGGGGGKSFHLQNENTPEIKLKHLELQINRLLEESINAGALRKDWGLALDLAKDCVAKERSLNRMKEQSGLMDSFGPNTDLTFATIFNLAEQYSNMKMWPEAINTYQTILKNRSFTNTGRLKMNIGEIYYRQGNYPKAIKFFRMALDQIPNSQTELRLKLMQNIGLSFVRLAQFADSIASFEYIMSEKGDSLDPLTIFHLIVCYYALGDSDKMRYYFNKLLQVKVDDQFEERYGHHEVLTNGGNLFATPNSPLNGTSAAGDIYNHRGPPYGSPGGIAGGPGGSEFASGVTGGGRISSPILLIRDEHDHHNNLLIDAIRNDRLRQYEKQKIGHAEWCILTAAKLIAPFIAIQPNGLSFPSSQNGIHQNSSIDSDSNGGGGGRKASLIEPTFNIPDTADINAGFEWCLEQIRRQASVVSISSGSISGLNFAQLADELELHKAVKHLRAREFDKAIATLKLFEKKDRLLLVNNNSNSGNVRNSTMVGSARATTAGGSLSVTPTFNEVQPRLSTAVATSSASTSGSGIGSVSSITTARVAATAATNLSFLYILQRDFETSLRYTEEAIQINRYSFGALLNKGTILYHTGDYQQAGEYYREVLANNQTSLEAHFNLALTERKLGNYEKALEILFRLRSLTKMVPNSQAGSGSGGPGTNNNSNSKNLYNQKICNTIDINVLFQIGSIYETMENIDQASDIYQQILNIVPTDISLLVKMADLAGESNDRKQSLSYLMEAYRYLPSHIPTIERLAAYHIEMKMYEKAIKHLEQLATIQPNQIKWQLMIAASYRRAGNYQQAFASYQEIHSRFPDNVDCLKLLIRLCTELDAEDSRSSRVRTGGTNYANLADQYADTLKRVEKSRELREQQQLLQLQQSSSRSASRTSTAGGFRSREGSAATSASSGGSSSGYNTSATPRSVKTPSKSTTPNSFDINQIPADGSGQTRGTSNHHLSKTPSISAIVDQVVEQLDSNTLNERPTTSWRRKSAFKNRANDNNNSSSAMSMIMPNGNDGGGAGADYDDDLLLDANIDEILPD